MTRLATLLEHAFSQDSHKSFFTNEPWSINFVFRTWDRYFELFYMKQRVLSGTTSEKKLTVMSQDPILVQKVLDDFAAVLPEYKVRNHPEKTPAVS